MEMGAVSFRWVRRAAEVALSEADASWRRWLRRVPRHAREFHQCCAENDVRGALQLLRRSPDGTNVVVVPGERLFSHDVTYAHISPSPVPRLVLAILFLHSPWKAEELLAWHDFDNDDATALHVAVAHAPAESSASPMSDGGQSSELLSLERLETCTNLLLMWDADVLARDRQGRNVVHVAAGHDNVVALGLLLGYDNAGSLFGCLDTELRSPLHLAAHNGCIATVEFLLLHGPRHGVDLAARDVRGHTALEVWGGHEGDGAVAPASAGESAGVLPEAEHWERALSETCGDRATPVREDPAEDEGGGISAGESSFREFESSQVKRVRKVAAGAQGDVFECRIVDHAGKFALKTVHRSAVQRAAVRSELELLSGIHHRGIVDVLGCVDVDQSVGIVMELYDDNLSDVVARYTEEFSLGMPYFGGSEACAWLHQLAAALAYLHGLDCPIAHRDLKLANVLVQYEANAGDLEHVFRDHPPEAVAGNPRSGVFAKTK
jgi:Protein kinase domain/Ankyrin repeats (3 copies)